MSFYSALIKISNRSVQKKSAYIVWLDLNQYFWAEVKNVYKLKET